MTTPPTEAALDVSDRVKNDAVREALARENLALRCLLGGGCDANDDGPHDTIVTKGKDRFCADCGEPVDARGRSKPWFHNGRLERVIERILATTPPAPVEGVEDSRPDFPGSIEAKVASYNDAHEDALEMGYPSLTEALEHLSELRATASPVERDLLANRALVDEGAKLRKKLGEGEFYAQGDRFELVWRPGGGCFASLDQVVAKMACGDTAFWLPGLIARLLNAALSTAAIPTQGEEKAGQ